MTRVASPNEKAVFINAPFDLAYEPLFVTLVGALVFLRQEPHCVLEVREEGAGRLQRIIDLMRSCRMSLHDLSRSGNPVRFNMPFELGLACAQKIAEPSKYEVFVLDARPHRLDRILSDYKGRDPLIHNGTCDGMLTCLLDGFVPPAEHTIQDYRHAARALREFARVTKREMRTSSLFRPALFQALVLAATRIAITHGFVKS